MISVLFLLLREFLDQEGDPEADMSKQSPLVLYNDVFVSQLGRY